MQSTDYVRNEELQICRSRDQIYLWKLQSLKYVCFSHLRPSTNTDALDIDFNRLHNFKSMMMAGKLTGFVVTTLLPLRTNREQPHVNRSSAYHKHSVLLSSQQQNSFNSISVNEDFCVLNFCGRLIQRT